MSDFIYIGDIDCEHEGVGKACGRCVILERAALRAEVERLKEAAWAVLNAIDGAGTGLGVLKSLDDLRAALRGEGE